MNSRRIENVPLESSLSVKLCKNVKDLNQLSSTILELGKGSTV